MLRSILIAITILLTCSAGAQTKTFRELKDWQQMLTTNITSGGCTASSAALNATETLFAFVCPDTAWLLVARNTDKGLQIGPVALQRAPGQWILVLKTANLAEIYVPYHNGIDRLSDTQFCTSAACTRPTDANDLGPNSTLETIGFATVGTKPTAVMEIRDRGPAWLCKWTANGGGSRTRRGQEMVLWSTWDPGNYDYVIEYHFRDDGQLSFRAGATGWNNSVIGTNVAHMHDFLWRVDLDLGNNANTAEIEHHDELTLSAFDSVSPFNAGFEGAMDLDEKRFATLVITDTMTNAAGNPIGYELQPSRVGTSRHFANGEGWTLHDTWVTRYHPSEATAALGPGWQPTDSYLLGNNGNLFGVFNHESVVGQDLVLWHVSSAHHEPHDEDQAANDPTFGHKGLTLMHWAGFDLVPHNLFDANPLGGPHRSTCDGAP